MEANFTGDDQWSESLGVPAGEFNLSIWGTFVAIVRIQRTFDNGLNWLEVDTYDAPIEQGGTEPEGSKYRVGIASGEYISGTVYILMGI